MKEAVRFCSENSTWVSEDLVCVLNSAADLPTLFDLELLKTIYYFFFKVTINIDSLQFQYETLKT